MTYLFQKNIFGKDEILQAIISIKTHVGPENDVFPNVYTPYLVLITMFCCPVIVPRTGCRWRRGQVFFEPLELHILVVQ